jgi:hypothetical protein
LRTLNAHKICVKNISIWKRDKEGGEVCNFGTEKQVVRIRSGLK